MKRLHAYLSLARISNAPTLVSNVLVGIALAVPLSFGVRLPVLVFAALMFYTAGMFLNDVCDVKIDRKERPERPIPQGIVSVWEALLIVLLLFGAGFGLLWPWGIPVVYAGAVLTGCIVLYDIWHKNNPISPVVMGACRGAVYVMAFLAFTNVFHLSLWIAVGWMLLYIMSLTWIARSENTNQFSSYIPAVIPFLPALYYFILYYSPMMFIAVFLYAQWLLYSLKYVYRKEYRNIGTAIGYLIAGISLLDAIILASTSSSSWWLLAPWLCFGGTLLLQRYIKGT